MRGTESAAFAELQRRGFAVTRPEAIRLAAFVDLLLLRNAEVNLVSRREATPEAILGRHVADALEGLALLPGPAGRRLRLLDVGSGGGFPALPLLVIRPDLEGILVEATGKKARFLEEAVRTLELTARVVNARFPDPALELMKHAVPCDLLTSRAVADAGGILRQARPALGPAAVALFWTTASLAEELQQTVPGASVFFTKSPGADRRGIARVERFT